MLARARPALHLMETMTNPSLPRAPRACPCLGNLESSAAALFAIAAGCSLKKQRRSRIRVQGQKVAELIDPAVDIRNVAFDAGENGKGGQAVLETPLVKGTEVQQDVVGAFLVGCMALPAWHVLPVFLDLKIAADPALPGLTADALPVSSTAIFVGWLVSATILDKALDVFDQKQLLVLHMLAMLVVAVAMITLPHLTAGNLVVFTGIRFVYGLLMNVTALQCVYIQDRLQPSQRNQVLVMNSVIYSLVVIMMAWSCSGLTLTWDWRTEALLWYGAPLVLALGIGFPDLWNIMRSIPLAVAKKFVKGQGPRQVEEVRGSSEEQTNSQDQRNTIALAVGFLACGCGFYGLTYSAGQLSPNPYVSCMLLHGGDIFGYILALSADKCGRNNVQACCFFAAGLCLLLCSTGEPGTALVLSAATVGRLCLDVCFTTIYISLANIFNATSSKAALTTCETTARLGGILAPLSGTWPASVSCVLFSSLCLAAACCTTTLPEEGPRVQSKPERGADNCPDLCVD